MRVRCAEPHRAVERDAEPLALLYVWRRRRFPAAAAANAQTPARERARRAGRECAQLSQGAGSAPRAVAAAAAAVGDWLAWPDDDDDDDDDDDVHVIKHVTAQSHSFLGPEQLFGQKVLRHG